MGEYHTDWTLLPDVTPVICPFVSELTLPTAAVLWGVNRPALSCSEGTRISWESTAPDSGIVAAQVTDGGPNNSLWYTASAAFKMNRATEVLPYIRPNGPLITTSSLKDWRACKNHISVPKGDPFDIKWFAFNDLCKKNAKPANLIAGVLSHEGFGTNGIGSNANGHEARAHWAAADPANDPYVLTEKLVASTKIALVGRVGTEVEGADSRISGIAGVEGTGNFSGEAWTFDTATDQFQKENKSF